MRLDRKFALVMGISLVWAFLVATVFYRVAGGGGRRGSAEEKPMVIASRPLPLGFVIHQDSVRTIAVPEHLFPKGGFGRVEEVVDRPVISPIGPEEAIVESRIAAKGSGMGLAPMIPPGMRAISVRVNDVVGVAGFVLPGMRVDVLVTGRPPDRDDTLTTTVLQNVPVLSAGQTIQADARSQPISATVVTLLVTPAEAESLTLANNEGRIQLVLRNSTDQQLARTPGRRLHELYASGVAVVATGPTSRPVPTKKVVHEVRPPTPTGVHPQAAAIDGEGVVIIRGNVKTVEPAPVTRN
jgi:pilus assembly protein CpaB